LQDWFAPDITSDATVGVGRWSVDDIAGYLKSGHNRISAATGPMAEEVALGSSRMSDEDLHAIATYLKSVPGGNTEASATLAANDPMMTAGAAIYRDQCSACHGLEGRGVDRLFPSLADSSVVRSSDPASLIRIVLRGARSVATDKEPTSPGMPAYGHQLGDSQVASVLTYVRNAWGAHAGTVGADTVRHTRSALAARSD
jgi:mono/diheme cytochrome c family protein